MQPPQKLNVLDAHGGFTAETRNGTLWRPGNILTDHPKRSTVGTLVDYNEHSFYQTNNDVTRATYKVPGYGYRVSVWFDNKDGHRIA